MLVNTLALIIFSKPLHVFLGTRISFVKIKKYFVDPTKKFFVDQTLVQTCKRKGRYGCKYQEAYDLCQQHGAILAKVSLVPDVINAFHAIIQSGSAYDVSKLRFMIGKTSEVS
jgi:hypothetical protein